MEEYLGILITHNADVTNIICQPMFINRTIKAIPNMNNVRSINSPVAI